MLDIRLLQKAVLDEQFNFAIVISFADDARLQRHLGILSRPNIDEDPKYIHLAFHSILKCEMLSPAEHAEHFVLFCPSMTPDEQLQMAVRAEKIYQRNGNKIPYSIAFGASPHFTAAGDLIQQTQTPTGFTCATFVLSLFEDMGFNIIDRASWKGRDDDAAWHHFIISTMTKHSYNKPEIYPVGYIDAQKAHIGQAVRFRPEEVAASAQEYQTYPILFNDAVALGEAVIHTMSGILINEKTDS